MDKNKKRNDMKKKIKDILENNYYNTGLDLQTATEELCILFSVSKSFLCLEEKETGKQTKCKEQCSYCRCK